MKVALIIPPSPFLFEPLTFPPLGPLYVSAYLKSKGHVVRVLDFTGEQDPKKWNARIARMDVDVVGITGVTPQFSVMLEIRKWLEHMIGLKWFMAGGPHASSDSQSCLDAGFQTVVVGDGELASDYALRNRVGGVVSIPSVDLDSLPFPDREAINIKDYHYRIEELEATSLIWKRGCPFSCAFCCHWEGYRMVRYRSPRNVAEEIQLIRDKYGYEAFMFWDDEFNLNEKKTIELCQVLKPLKIKFRCFIRADLFTRKLGEAMVGAGCVEVGCGVESGSQRILDNIHKGTKVEQNTEARKICRDLGIRFKAFTIIGLPGEDVESVNQTREWLRKNEPDDFDVCVFMPYPGSPIWENPEKYDVQFDKDAIKKGLYDETFYKGPPKSLVRTSKLSARDIVTLRDEIEDEFNRRVRSRWLWQRQA